MQGTPCDLITGEERSYADPAGNPSSHVSCTVEMTSINTPCKLTPSIIYNNNYLFTLLEMIITKLSNTIQ